MAAARHLVSLLVVLVAAVCVVQAQERIKMCGRDLIRLAVSYCGNPRNRRSLPDVELDQSKTIWNQDSSSMEQQTPEILQLQSDGETPPFSMAPHWFSPSFRLRRAAKKVSDICCEEGCSMKELIQFC